ncbi:MAG: DNA methyltransferase [bacterium]
MTKEQKFYKALQDVFIGAKIEGKGGFVNLMRIKSNYYCKIEDILKKDIEAALKSHPKFRDELFDKLYSFFNRYFTESGSIYFNSTPFHNNIYEKVYTDEKDVILFWKTQMLYYVKTDRIFRSLPVEFPSDRGVDAKGGQGVFKFYFDVSKIEGKKANEKRSLIFELNKIHEDGTIVLDVQYSEKGTKTKQDEILKAIKKKDIAITEEQLERAFRVFEKQSEVDFFINKNAKAFLQEQFKLWSYQYFWEGAGTPLTPLQEGNAWSADRVNQLQILKDIAFKIIDFISQFEDELVKLWNKPKFVKNSNYVITLDRIMNTLPAIADTPLEEGNNSPSLKGWQTKPDGVVLITKILNHPNINEQIKEWQELGIVDENFKVTDVFENSPSLKGWQAKPDGVVKWNELPFDTKLKERAKELRKAGNLSEVLFWNQVKNKQFLGLDFDRQKIIGNYIVDFYCKNLGVVVEIDGVSHDGKVERDKQRDDYFKNLGLKVIHILDTDVKNNLSGVMEFLEREFKHPVPLGHPSTRGEFNPVLSGHPSIRGEFKHLPIDTKYFKDLELEILSQFDDLDKSLDGWLIKSENYQALNTILPKFKEKVQTIYIDPPFNLDSSDQFLYRTNYKDANWATLLENRLKLAKDWLNKKGSIFVRCDYNGNWIVRCLMDEILPTENKREIILRKANSQGALGNFNPANESLFFYQKDESLYYFKPIFKTRNREIRWVNAVSPKENKDANKIVINGKEYIAPKGNHWRFSQEKFNKLLSENRIRISPDTGLPQYLESEEVPLDTNWTDMQGYSFSHGFSTENAEVILQRVIDCSSEKNFIIFDFFLGSGTTTAVAHKLGRKWIGVEMGEHFYTVVLPRMKKVLAYDKSGISKELKTPRQTSSDTPLKEGNYEGGGFFKYYELEQYEEALANCKYEESDLFNSPSKTPYQEYVFMKDEKMLKALEIDYENNKVKVDLTKLYLNTPSSNDATPLKEGNIDIAETLSNLTGKWIKKITPLPPLQEGNYEVEFEDGTKINTKNLDYKLIKPLIWWE